MKYANLKELSLPCVHSGESGYVMQPYRLETAIRLRLLQERESEDILRQYAKGVYGNE